VIDQGAIDVVIDKGTTRDAEGYSAFESQELHGLIRERGLDLLTVTGLATDHCVKHTARDAVREGLRVRIPTAAVRGIDADGSRRALSELSDVGAPLL
jgi:nicotinamidase/pyrazinamidase